MQWGVFRTRGVRCVVGRCGFRASGGGRGWADYPIERTCTADIRHNPSREATNRIYPAISIQRQAVTSRRKGRSTRTGPCLSEYPHGPRGKSKRLEQKTANAEFAVGDTRQVRPLTGPIVRSTTRTRNPRVWARVRVPSLRLRARDEERDCRVNIRPARLRRLLALL